MILGPFSQPPMSKDKTKQDKRVLEFWTHTSQWNTSEAQATPAMATQGWGGVVMRTLACLFPHPHFGHDYSCLPPLMLRHQQICSSGMQVEKAMDITSTSFERQSGIPNAHFPLLW